MLYGYLNSPFVSNPFSDAAIPPTSLTSPVISGSGIVGQTLSTTNGTWSGTLPITYTYQWNRNGSVILGATFNTYTLVTADGSTSITCTVTATNAGGFASSTSNAISVAAAGDADANAFIAAAAITDTTQKAAIDKLVVDLKGYGIWTKMKAIYPFIGGTAAQHKFNLRSPLDTDAAFRLVFNGGWTHSSTGALPNGTNAWANTWFKSGTNFTSKDNAHYSFYSRTDLSSTSVEIGANADVSQQVLHTRKTDGKAYFIINGGAQPNFSVTNSLGFYQANRNVLNIANGWKNGAKLTEITSTSVVNNLTYFSISAYNNPINLPELYSAKQAAFASFGDGLTDTQAANYYTAVQTFQTTLSRNV